jgi:AAA domain
MPTVSKQTTAVNSVNKAPAGSILSRAIPVEELEETHQKFVLYGSNRVGKTSMSVMWPKPLLLISFEPGTTGGAKSVKKVPGVTFLQITSKDDAIKLASELKVRNDFKTHVLDTVTSLQDIILKEIMGYDDLVLQQNWGSVGREQYGVRAERCKEVLRAFRDLKCHTVFVAQEKDHSPPQDNGSKLTRGLQLESFFAADLGGATVKWMHDGCDYICRLYIEKEVITTERQVSVGGKMQVSKEEVVTGRQVRKLLTMYHQNYAAGLRSETPEAVPEYIQAATPKEMYDAIQMVISGKKTDKGKYG